MMMMSREFTCPLESPVLLTHLLLTAATSFVGTNIGYVTFGKNSPGAEIGNLYFSTWLSFIFIVFIFANNFRDLVDSLTQHQDQSSGGGVGAVGDEEQIQHDGDVATNTNNFPDLPDEDDI
jgi:hypothetical protein